MGEFSNVGAWLEEAGLGRYGGAFAGMADDAFRCLLMQDYSKFGVNSMEDKQTLFRLIKKINVASRAKNAAAAAAAAEMPKPPAGAKQAAAGLSVDGHAAAEHMQAVNVYSNAGMLDAGAGLLDLNDHDGDLLSPSNNFLEDGGLSGQVSPSMEPLADGFLGPPSSRPQHLPPHAGAPPAVAPAAEAPLAQVDPNPPKIRVVVRKRPLNRKEIERADEDIVDVLGPDHMQVNETKVKVDLTKYMERHQFSFDDTLDEHVTNDEVYRATVQPLVGTLFRGGKATCFAYGQTGSGKTYTMSPLPMRAGRELLDALAVQDEEYELWVSNFEIYGGKLYDLLNQRKKLRTLENGKSEVCIMGLEEHPVQVAAQIEQMIQKGAGERSVGTTGANADSSRSHSIVQFALKKALPSGNYKLVGKLSFIDLAGSERGADTFDNCRQTRLEGAEINKSLLALKECIRALDLDKGHVPFRGSKLTEVLRDSFVGKEARTVMIANISPNTSSVEHTLNTLRYADRVKELRKDRADRIAGSVTPSSQGYNRAAPAPPAPLTNQLAMARPGSAALRRDAAPLPPPARPPQLARVNNDRPPSREAEKSCEGNSSDEVDGSYEAYGAGPEDAEVCSERDELMNSILQEEDDLIAAHRKQIEETMELVRKEMNLLAEVDQPGSHIDSYVANLAAILEAKASGTAKLQAQLAAFQRKLAQEEAYSRAGHR
mmetsp:Transcript_3040/g.7577  ORF Transcript_3040/g.7577 Transcript_3040/m.7577 type:complete len:713 (-) Transcript_3040:98-2236(-)